MNSVDRQIGELYGTMEKRDLRALWNNGTERLESSMEQWNRQIGELYGTREQGEYTGKERFIV